MIPQSYTINAPVDQVPPSTPRPLKDRDDYRHIYMAAERARGAWVPVVFGEKARAHRFAEVARRRTTTIFDVEVRSETVFLRVRR